MLRSFLSIGLLAYSTFASSFLSETKDVGNVGLMDIGTVLGFVVGIGLFVGSVLATPDWAVFLNAPSLAIVVGGTFASAFVSYRTRYVLIALADIFGLWGVRRWDVST